MVELLQLSGGDGELITTVSSPCPRASAMKDKKEPEEGRDLALQPAGNRVSKRGEAAPQRPAAHMGPAKFKPAERLQSRALPASTARASLAYQRGDRSCVALVTRGRPEGFVQACWAWLSVLGPLLGITRPVA